MEQFALWLGTFLAPIIKPIFMACLKEYFGDTAELGKPNDDLESLAKRLREQGNRSQTGNDSHQSVTVQDASSRTGR